MQQETKGVAMVRAYYASRCDCGDRIGEGDMIGLVDGEWVCGSCVDAMGGEDGPTHRRDDDDYWLADPYDPAADSVLSD